jgi:hypothetical protein
MKVYSKKPDDDGGKRHQAAPPADVDHESPQGHSVIQSSRRAVSMPSFFASLSTVMNRVGTCRAIRSILGEKKDFQDFP